MTPEIIIGDAITRMKCETAAGEEKLIIMSPYVTGGIVQDILGNRGPESCEVYTLFSVELFARGSSSIAALEKLAAKGYGLYELPGLHAKLILDANRCLMIGSQNLTLHGRTGKEATVLIRDPELVAVAQVQLDEWLQERRAISLEMIWDMKQVLLPLKQMFEDVRVTVTQTEEHLRQQEEIREQEREQARLEAERQAAEELRLLREEEERRRIEEDVERRRQEEEAEFAGELLDDWYAEEPEEDLPGFDEEDDEHISEADTSWTADVFMEAFRIAEEAREREKRYKEFLQAIRRIELQTRRVHTVVREIHSHNWRSSSHIFSLVRTRNRSLTSWQLPDESLELKRLHRYLCLIEHTGKLGWARVGKERITYVWQHVNRTDLDVWANDIPCRAVLAAVWDNYVPGAPNLQVILTPHRGGGKVVINSWFSPQSLRFIEFTAEPDNSWYSSDMAGICDWTKDNAENLEQEVTKALLTPFLYQERLLGVQADEFFGPPGTQYYLRLAKLHDQPVLIAE